MIQIDVSWAEPPVDSEETRTLQMEHVRTNYDNIAVFLRECIDQNLILNFFHDAAPDYKRETTTYYSADWESARIFEQKFQDTSAEFSLRKLWNELGYDTRISMKEIDFSTVDTTEGITDLLDEDARILWAIYF